MEEHIKLRLEYKKLIREGKKEAALQVLKKIWAKNNKVVKPELEVKVIESKKKITITKEGGFSRISSLE